VISIVGQIFIPGLPIPPLSWKRSRPTSLIDYSDTNIHLPSVIGTVRTHSHPENGPTTCWGCRYFLYEVTTAASRGTLKPVVPIGSHEHPSTMYFLAMIWPMAEIMTYLPCFFLL